MRLVVDASVAAKWFIIEPDSHLAASVRNEDLIAPAILRIECANALIKRLRIGEIDERQTRSRLGRVSTMPVTLHPLDEDRSIDLALQLRHPAWDCGYLALALEQRIRVVTADERFYRHATDGGYGANILLLSDYA